MLLHSKSIEYKVNTDMRDRIIKLLESTGRENIDRVISWMDSNGFFDAPASVIHHNNFKGGLAKHSYDVYEQAVKLNETRMADGRTPLPLASIIICSLLHDVCKCGQYFIDDKGKASCNSAMREKGHGIRSMYILKRTCGLPLNYDEEMAIWWHTDQYEQRRGHEKQYKESIGNELCELIRKADGIAAS